MTEADLLQLLRGRDLPMRHKPGGSLFVRCPHCPDKRTHYRLFWTYERAKCYRCGHRGSLFAALRDLIDISWPDYKRVADRIVAGPGETTTDMVRARLDGDRRQLLGDNSLPVVVPPGVPINEHVLAAEPLLASFLSRRRLTLDDCMDGGFLWAGNFGEYAHRLIIPVTDAAGRTVSYQARDCTGRSDKKYLTMRGVALDRLLYWTDTIQDDAPTRVYVVEGVFDALRLEYNSVATFTKAMSAPQRQALAAEDIDELVMCWDADAWNASLAAARLLGPLFHAVGAVQLPDGEDPDTLGAAAVRALPIMWL